MATSTNGELLALSGLRSPYEGKLGVVAESALADLLLVDGDPIANIRLIEDPERNFRAIMKDGRIYKNSLQESMRLRTVCIGAAVRWPSLRWLAVPTVRSRHRFADPREPE
jgi:hypothetical protein